MIFYDIMPSPVGELLLVAEASGLTGVYFKTYRHGRQPGTDWRPAADRTEPAPTALAETRAQLGAYFAGQLTVFALPLAAPGTAFQARVWAELSRIAWGETITYGELARRIVQMAR
jgi:methylated-DNA-[protein]-cysteine S-methyltransferase